MSYQSELLRYLFVILLSFHLSKCNYMAMEENMEKIFKQYLTFSFEGNLLPNRK